MKLLSVSTLMVMMPVRHVAVTMGLNTLEEEESVAPLLLPPPPPIGASAVPTDAVLFGVTLSELELEIVGALSSASEEGLCAAAN